MWMDVRDATTPMGKQKAKLTIRFGGCLYLSELSEEIIFYDSAVDKHSGKVKDSFTALIAMPN